MFGSEPTTLRHVLKMWCYCIWSTVWNGLSLYPQYLPVSPFSEYWINPLVGKIAAQRRHRRIFCLHLSASAGRKVGACFAHKLARRECFAHNLVKCFAHKLVSCECFAHNLVRQRESKADNLTTVSLKVNKSFSWAVAIDKTTWRWFLEKYLERWKSEGNI